MAKASQQQNIDVLFFHYLWDFYRSNKGTIRRSYRKLTKIFLDFNDPDNNPDAFLRRPQFEALEIYVLIKEGLENVPVWRIFNDWHTKQNLFASRPDAYALADEQGKLFGNIDADSYAEVFKRMRSVAQDYNNYIFALTMGVGKTLLMASCIAYEFLLARKFPRDEKYCHNVLIFAPDTTVLQSLREIVDFDYGNIVPDAYADLLRSNMKFWFLEDTSMTLNVQDDSMFNIVISNAQKIIIRSSHKEKTSAEKLFSADVLPGSGAQARMNQLLGIAEIVSENDLAPNQRFQKLLRLRQLGIFVDEAHHAFGKNLARDVGAESDTRKTSLRKTISALAAAFRSKGSHVVGCYNFTGTPYAKGRIFPEVVYAYGLSEAINKQYLKRARLVTYDNVKTVHFVEDVLQDFFNHHKEQRYEGKLPKIAFFATTIDELETELRPEVERVMAKLNLPVSALLVNHQKSSSDQVREFHRLDSPQSTKQIILLVNKGKEGWNCRSLFGVALYRKPKSKIFVLQASMRCLRRIGFPPQHQGSIYLTTENSTILEAELEANFRMSVEDFKNAGTTKERYEVRPLPPPRKVTVRRTQTLFDLRKNSKPGTLNFHLDELDLERYQIHKTEREGLILDKTKEVREEISTYGRTKRYTQLSLVAECARYLGMPNSEPEEGHTAHGRGEQIGLRPTEIHKLLASSEEGIGKVLELVNQHNDILFDVIIPGIFNYLYKIESYTKPVDEEINLVETPESGGWVLSGEPELTMASGETENQILPNTFHLDHYIFDSKPEFRFYRDMLHLLREKKVQQVYFTGMLTHGQSKFNVPYVDPETNTLRTYYPDFLIETEKGKWVIVEVKGAHQIDNAVVKAKAFYANHQFSTDITSGNTTFSYCLLSDRDIMDGRSSKVLVDQLTGIQEAIWASEG